jgi:nucleoside-diphosphate-sugar epimerase
MKKILVLGGTRFFGKKLVNLLLEEADVTIATRGKTEDSFGKRVTRLQLDREVNQSLKSAVETRDWDIIYDNICYSPQAAQDACEIFAGKVKRYIFTSTMAVYELGKGRRIEEEFEPYTHPIQLGKRSDFSYEEGKRLAESVFFQRASFPVCAVRFPIVLGTDDYTNRLKFHIDHVREGLPIEIPNLKSLKSIMSFISSDEAAKFLAWLGNQDIQGAINACSKGELSLKNILAFVEETVGKKAIIEGNSNGEHLSPFGITDSWCMNTSKAKKAGFAFKSISDWFPQLVKELAL